MGRNPAAGYGGSRLANSRADYDIFPMKLLSIPACAVLAVFATCNGAFAQAVVPPGGSLFNPPPPPPPPPPKMDVPVVPKLDEPQRQDYLPPPRPSFSDRISRCLDEGAASGLGPSDRAAYSRSCANR
jgi:hypothetical protein